MPVRFGLIGYPLSHSFSKGYFNAKFSRLGLPHTWYETFEIKDVDQVKQVLVGYPELEGFNVTLPHKVNIMPLLHSISAEALEVGAVNTVKITRKNHQMALRGFNTDVFGFEMSIKPFLESHHQKALILGNGGATKAVEFVMKKLGIDYLIVTRNPVSAHHISYSQINQYVMQQYLFVVNTTPLGMYPNTNEMPLFPVELVTRQHLIMDLIYNPEQTKLLQLAKEKGAKILNGLSMLHLQADKAYQIWTGHE